jgi:hypothetical protein
MGVNIRRNPSQSPEKFAYVKDIDSQDLRRFFLETNKKKSQQTTLATNDILSKMSQKILKTKQDPIKMLIRENFNLTDTQPKEDTYQLKAKHSTGALQTNRTTQYNNNHHNSQNSNLTTTDASNFIYGKYFIPFNTRSSENSLSTRHTKKNLHSENHHVMRYHVLQTETSNQDQSQFLSKNIPRISFK